MSVTNLFLEWMETSPKPKERERERGNQSTDNLTRLASQAGVKLKIQRHILVFLLILALLRNLCDAQCSVKPVGKKGCFQNGKWYRAPAVWKTNNCQRCECKPKELICCSLPINYDKKKCIAMFHRQSCSIRVVKKNDPTESCQVFAGVEYIGYNRIVMAAILLNYAVQADGLILVMGREMGIQRRKKRNQNQAIPQTKPSCPGQTKTCYTLRLRLSMNIISPTYAIEVKDRFEPLNLEGKNPNEQWREMQDNTIEIAGKSRTNKEMSFCSTALLFLLLSSLTSFGNSKGKTMEERYEKTPEQKQSQKGKRHWAKTIDEPSGRWNSFILLIRPTWNITSDSGNDIDNQEHAQRRKKNQACKSLLPSTAPFAFPAKDDFQAFKDGREEGEFVNDRNYTSAHLEKGWAMAGIHRLPQ
ncbi:hypothetical protein L345_07442, partial [Ophiophagus hannah]